MMPCPLHTNEKPPAELQSPPIENFLATVLQSLSGYITCQDVCVQESHATKRLKS